MNILIVGGAGYIGSHMVKTLSDLTGYDITILDNLTTGIKDAVCSGTFVQGDINDRELLRKIFSQGEFDAVIHFASLIQVGESVLRPDLYYENNFINTIFLLNAMVEAKVKKFIFSSTAAIFGEPVHIPINEAHQKIPINPYGRSKLMVEQVLEDYDHAFGLKSVCLRYFNAAGADPNGDIGEMHDPETHLIPILLQVASGRRKCASVFGTDYPTDDGTCIRDYIHVMDLCDAHVSSLIYLCNQNKSERFNLGNGSGFSVSQVIDTVRRVTGKPLAIEYCQRRVGDPAVLVADATRAKAILNWHPKYIELDTIVTHAWNFEKNSLKYC